MGELRITHFADTDLDPSHGRHCGKLLELLEVSLSRSDDPLPAGVMPGVERAVDPRKEGRKISRTISLRT